MRCFVLDSCAVDPIADTPGAYEAVRAAVDEGRVEILFPHVTLDEVAQTDRLERRQLLLVVLVSLGRFVVSGGFVLGKSRLDQARLGGDAVTLEALGAGTEKNSRDALIGITADFEQCTLVTRDKRLIKRAHERGISVVRPLDFLAQLGLTAGDTS